MSKTAWPELIGRPWKEASFFVRKEYPNIMVQVVRNGVKVTRNQRPDRVLLLVDSDGQVTQMPVIG